MTVQLKTREQVKEEFYRKGITVKDWAERHNFKYTQVIDVLRKPGPCSYGQPAMVFRLIPAGLFRANDGRPHGLPGWFIDGETARQIIVSLSVQKNDMLIDYEHQSINVASKGGKP